MTDHEIDEECALMEAELHKYECLVCLRILNTRHDLFMHQQAHERGDVS